MCSTTLRRSFRHPPPAPSSVAGRLPAGIQKYTPHACTHACVCTHACISQRAVTHMSPGACCHPYAATICCHAHATTHMRPRVQGSLQGLALTPRAWPLAPEHLALTHRFTHQPHHSHSTTSPHPNALSPPAPPAVALHCRRKSDVRSLRVGLGMHWTEAPTGSSLSNGGAVSRRWSCLASVELSRLALASLSPRSRLALASLSPRSRSLPRTRLRAIGPAQMARLSCRRSKTSTAPSRGCACALRP